MAAVETLSPIVMTAAGIKIELPIWNMKYALFFSSRGDSATCTENFKVSIDHRFAEESNP
jgi:hypothetical protein